MNHILDNIGKIESMDKSGMYDRIFHFPEQIEEATEIGKALKPNPEYYTNIENIVVVGMGGSAIGGDLVRSFLTDEIKIPFQICRNYNIPGFVNQNSLVIASSYSGNTEETLSAFEQAVNKKAKIFCLTTGGKLGELAKENDYLTAKLPAGYQPRAALGFSAIPLLYFMMKINLIGDFGSDIGEIPAGLKAYRQQYEINSTMDNNPAKQLAAKLFGKIPIIYTGPEMTDVIGVRWKGQICENAECLAFCNQFPEFNHNELVGWHKIDSFKDHLIVVYLRDSDDGEPISRRMAIVRDIIKKLGVETVSIVSQGDFRLGRIFSLIQIGDFTSFYLAILNGVDPTPVKAIDHLKNELAAGRL